MRPDEPVRARLIALQASGALADLPLDLLSFLD